MRLTIASKEKPLRISPGNKALAYTALSRFRYKTRVRILFEHTSAQPVLTSSYGTPELSGRRKRYVNNFKQEESQEGQACWGRGSVILASQHKVSGTIGYTTGLSDGWVHYEYSSTRRGNRVMLLCFVIWQRTSSFSGGFIASGGSRETCAGGENQDWKYQKPLMVDRRFPFVSVCFASRVFVLRNSLVCT